MFVWDISQARFHFSKSDWQAISESENWFENNSKLINFGEWMTCQFQNRWQRARWYSEMFSQSSLVDFSGWFRSVAPPSRLWIFYPIWCLMEWFSKRSMKRNPVLLGGFVGGVLFLWKTGFDTVLGLENRGQARQKKYENEKKEDELDVDELIDSICSLLVIDSPKDRVQPNMQHSQSCIFTYRTF